MGVIYRNGVAYGGAGGVNMLMLAPLYDATSTYAVNDYCVYSGKLYRCTTAISTEEAWDSTHWTEERVMDKITELLNSQS